MGFAFLGLGTLIGGPGGGAILGADENWTGTWVFGGVVMLASSVIFVALRCWKFGYKLKVKA